MPDRPWWGEHRLEAGSGCLWTLGDFSVGVLRRRGEWQVVHADALPVEPDCDGWALDTVSELPSMPGEYRFASGETGALVQLLPRVPDRSLVARPRVPLHVLPGERVEIHVSFPVWLDVTVDDHLSLLGLPIRALSDTWIGESTRSGELAYALRTQAHRVLEDVPRRSYRAITPVVIRNEGKDVLPVQRMHLPAPYLSLFSRDEESLWTERITFLRGESQQMAEFEIERTRASHSAGERLSPPRVEADSSFLFRAFSTLLGPFDGGDSDE